MRNKYSVFSLIKNALSYHENWQRAWKDPAPKKEYDAVIVGGGGREHALAWKAAQSSKVEMVYVAPGNAGTANEDKVTNIEISADDINALKTFAKKEEIELTIVGPEAPLVDGIVDDFQESGLRCFGPTKAAAELEGSKSFCKNFLKKYQQLNTKFLQRKI